MGLGRLCHHLWAHRALPPTPCHQPLLAHHPALSRPRRHSSPETWEAQASALRPPQTHPVRSRPYGPATPFLSRARPPRLRSALPSSPIGGRGRINSQTLFWNRDKDSRREGMREGKSFQMSHWARGTVGWQTQNRGHLRFQTKQVGKPGGSGSPEEP